MSPDGETFGSTAAKGRGSLSAQEKLLAPQPPAPPETPPASEAMSHASEASDASPHAPPDLEASPRTHAAADASSETPPPLNPERARYIPLLWRVLAVNVALLIAMGIVTVAVLPDRFERLAPDEAAVLAIALVATLVANTILLRRALAPLRQLAKLMSTVDPLRHGTRAPPPKAPSEIADLAHAYNEMLDDLEHERRESTRRAVAAQEAERLRIAQELHDDVGQTLTAVLLQLGRLRREARAELAPQIHTTSETAREGIEAIRRVSQHLRPEALDDLGLPGALDALCERVAEHADMRVERELARQLPLLSEETELVIYRVAQEALTNAVRHSGGSRVQLRLRVGDDAVTLTVDDDGRGLGKGDGHRGGLAGMHERAALIRADLDVSSPEIGGTIVKLTVPA